MYTSNYLLIWFRFDLGLLETWPVRPLWFWIGLVSDRRCCCCWCESPLWMVLMTVARVPIRFPCCLWPSWCLWPIWMVLVDGGFRHRCDGRDSWRMMSLILWLRVYVVRPVYVLWCWGSVVVTCSSIGFNGCWMVGLLMKRIGFCVVLWFLCYEFWCVYVCLFVRWCFGSWKLICRFRLTV